MVRSVVLDEIDFLRKILAKNLFEVFDVRVGIENFLEMVKKTSTVQFYCSENFQGISLAGRRDFWLRTYSGPGLIKGWILPEAGFVLEEDGGLFALCFFLMSG